MAYRDYLERPPSPIVHIDWPSLRAVPLIDANGTYTDLSLGEVVEVMSDWRDREDDDLFRRIAPGESPAAVSAVPIAAALRVAASVLIGGIAGNAAYELIKKAIGL